uniref:Antistasin-like domain-containing protein n=1 Tax=Strigamia maritima TaxID=126957 RepID=T1IKF2_STRMM
MKLSLLLLFCFTALCIEYGLSSEIEEFQTGKRPNECYKVLRGLSPNCCNTKPMFNPCSAVRCGYETQCVLHHTPARPPNCADDFPLQPRCEHPCPMRKCAPYCIPTVGKDNCPSCYCEENSNFDNPCLKENACASGKECVLRDVTCLKISCYPRKQCRPKCPPEEVCPNNCLPYVDENGCKKCHCCNDCVNKKCPESQKCVLNQVQCFTCPCPPIAECH